MVGSPLMMAYGMTLEQLTVDQTINLGKLVNQLLYLRNEQVRKAALVISAGIALIPVIVLCGGPVIYLDFPRL